MQRMKPGSLADGAECGSDDTEGGRARPEWGACAHKHKPGYTRTSVCVPDTLTPASPASSPRVAATKFGPVSKRPRNECNTNQNCCFKNQAPLQNPIPPRSRHVPEKSASAGPRGPRPADRNSRGPAGIEFAGTCRFRERGRSNGSPGPFLKNNSFGLYLCLAPRLYETHTKTIMF